MHKSAGALEAAGVEFQEETEMSGAGSAAQGAEAMSETDLETKQFAIVVERAPQNGYPTMVDYVDVHNPRMPGLQSVINPPPSHYTYSLIELRSAMALLRKAYPDAYIEAHEVAYIDHAAMLERWSQAREARS